MPVKPYETDTEVLSLDEAEIAQRKAFLDFTERDVGLLVALHDRLEKAGECDFFVEDFYRHLLSFPETRALIPDERTLARLKATQSEYFHSLTGGDYGHEYILNRLRVGTAHQRVGLHTKWYIGAYNKYLNLLLPKIARLAGEAGTAEALKKSLDTISAVLKITFLDLGIAVETYAHADQLAVRRQAARLSALNQLALAVSSSLDLKDILDRIITHGMALSGARAVCAALYSEETGRFREWIAKGLAEDTAKGMLLHTGGAARAAMDRNTWVVASDRPGATHPLNEVERAENIRAVACLPLASRTRSLGVLCFYRGDKDQFEPDEIELFSTFGSLAAEAIKNARIHAKTVTLATMDPLTGLPNRRNFDERLALEVHRSRRYGAPFALLMLDIDDFKKINDGHGHPAGDTVLRAIGGVLSDQLRNVDFAARYGGEEFAILLAETDAAQAKQVAERIRHKIMDTPFRLPHNDSLRTSVSVGIGCFPICATSEESVLTHADQALYAAKRDGKNRVVLYRDLLKLELEHDPGRVAALLAQDLENIAPVMAAIAVKAEYMREHPSSTARYARLIGEALGLPADELEALDLAARLHDIGFISMPEAILNKPAVLLNDVDLKLLKSHPVVGAEILEQVPALRAVAPIVRHHHEHYDGSGYPDGLAGEVIPMLARILAVADVFDAMTAHRPQRGGLVPADAKQQLLSGAGQHFDPGIVTAFVKLLESGDLGRGVTSAIASLDNPPLALYTYR